MAELLPDAPFMLHISNAERRAAALSLAECFEDKHPLAYMLVILGLAEHRADGTFVATADAAQNSWFSPRTARIHETFALPVGTLDDRR